MVDELASSEDLRTFLALNFEQLLTHVDAVGDLSCPIVLLNLRVLSDKCAFILADSLIEPQIFLAERHDVVAA